MATLGIDLGTSTTLAASAEADQATFLADAKGSTIFPSVVAFAPNGECLVGEEAKYRRPIDAPNTIFSAKRIIGQHTSAEVVKAYREHYPMPLIDKQGVPHFQTRAGDFTAVTIAARVLGKVRQMARAKNLAPTRVAVGVPAEFRAFQRTATLDAAHDAGFAQAFCVEEPHAVIRAYLDKLPKGTSRVVVYDLGGGTFNVAVGEIVGPSCRILATGGDDYLGGDDVDQLLARFVNEAALAQFGWDFTTSPQSHTRLLAACEQAKITLSQLNTTRIKLMAIESNDALRGQEIVVERATLERLVLELVRKTFLACDEVLSRAGLTIKDIDAVVLAGGSCRIPFVQAAVGRYFAKPPVIDPHPDRLVALGAALLAQDSASAASVGVSVEHEKRKAGPRVSVSLRASADFGPLGEFENLPVSDISKGGLFLRLSQAIPLRTAVQVTIATGPDTEAPLTLPGEVVFCLSPEDALRKAGAVPGVGIAFGELMSSTKTELEALVSEAGQLFGVVKPQT